MRFIGVILAVLYGAISFTRAIPVPASKLEQLQLSLGRY
jgi:hypothetical protein